MVVENSLDPDQLASYKPADQDLQFSKQDITGISMIRVKPSLSIQCFQWNYSLIVFGSRGSCLIRAIPGKSVTGGMESNFFRGTTWKSKVIEWHHQRTKNNIEQPPPQGI